LNEFQPAFSPDGTRIAFCSDRSTGHSVEIWVAAADGSGAHPLTQGPSHCSPHWSPDGRSIVFDSMSLEGTRHIWSVDSEGGTPRQLTHEPGHQEMPSWSHDGLWVYFAADRGNGKQIWRVNVRDGTERQLTHAGAGPYSIESADGLSLLYQPQHGDSPLLSLPLGGGKATQLIECVQGTKFAANLRGIYYVACDEGSDPRLRFMDRQTGRDRVLGKLEKLALGMPGLTVSPDGSTILYSRLSHISADLMLIENFR
jgi:Tol biopolymer transport system component